MPAETHHAPHRVIGQFWFALLAILVGAVAGIGAVLFRGLIAIIHNAAFLGKFSVFYNANTHTPASPWGIFVIVVPVIGAAGVAFVVKTFAPEARGHGVPEVMDAIYYGGGRIRPIVALIKAVASALSIGTGGSVGREGPIIQIGSSFGSTIGQLLKAPTWQCIVLIACGAGGGIAATFNTPVGGVLFVLELMLQEVSARTLVPVAIATATATYVGRLCFGGSPSFVIPAMETPYFHVTQPLMLPVYLGLGFLIGVVAALFIRSIYGFEDFFEKRIRGSYYRQHLLGMLAVGIMIYCFLKLSGHYYVEGVGYAAVQDVLSSVKFPLYLLLILFAAKLLGTSLTLGSGASGGVFSPALFLGATVGAVYGMVLHAAFPSLDITPSAFAVAGMAGMVGSSTGAAVTSIVMIFEMTLDYHVIVPMTVVVAISYGVRILLCKESIYTLKLSRRGHYLPNALRSNSHFMKHARTIMETRLGKIAADAAGDAMSAAITNQPDVAFFLVTEQDDVIGFLDSGIMYQTLVGAHASAGKLANRKFTRVREETNLEDVLVAMRAAGVSVALVTEGPSGKASAKIKGIITKKEIAQAMLNSAELYLG